MPARRAPSGGTRTAAGKDEPASAILAHVTRHYLALDLGAESGRAMLAHIDRRKIEISELHRFKNTPVSLPTGLYWDTLYMFHEICESIRIAARSVDRLDGIGIDTWGVDLGLLALSTVSMASASPPAELISHCSMRAANCSATPVTTGIASRFPLPRRCSRKSPAPRSSARPASSS